MKITKETKIGDIIPEGWDIDPTNYPIAKNQDGNPCLIHIPLKKKEEKNFEWYVTEYFNSNDTVIYMESHYNIYLGECFEAKDYNSIPFEVRIGLLKFICEDIAENSNIKIGWLYTLELIQKYTPHTVKPKIMDICPKEFLDSILNNQ